MLVYICKLFFLIFIGYFFLREVKLSVYVERKLSVKYK